MNGPDTAVGVTVIDLKSGQEMWINPDVAFSSLSTIKIPIMINRFRTLTLDPDNDTRWLMAASILCSSNSASNLLMQTSSLTNDLRDGLQKVISTAQALGAKNTYIDAPLYVGDKTLQFSIPAPKTAPDKTVNTHPDIFSQTTPSDMATLLQELYDCAQYGSGLRAVYPDSFSQIRCKQMVELLSGNVINRLIELGTPPEPGSPIKTAGAAPHATARTSATPGLSIRRVAITFWSFTSGKPKPTRTGSVRWIPGKRSKGFRASHTISLTRLRR